MNGAVTTFTIPTEVVENRKLADAKTRREMEIKKLCDNMIEHIVERKVRELKILRKIKNCRLTHDEKEEVFEDLINELKNTSIIVDGKFYNLFIENRLSCKTLRTKLGLK